MINLFLHIFIYFAFALTILFFIGMKFSQVKIWTKSKKKGKQNFKSSSISVIIPFRNEEENLPKLLESLLELSIKPLEIIFVNDHSEDESVKVIENFESDFLKTILYLDENEFGKKRALRKGIEFSNGEFILSWDADITMQKDFFVALEKNRVSDILLLPVKMKGKNLISFFAELDFYYINNLNISCFGLFKPILANGANMLFNKEVFLKNDSIQMHEEISSGDDVFILNDFKKHKSHLALSLENKLTVETSSPRNFSDFINQRLRWIKKTNKVGDNFANIIGAIGIFYHLGFLVLFILLDFNLYIILLKILFDILIMINYLVKIKRPILIFLMPLFSVFYPIYVIFIAILSLLIEVKWKNRKI